MVWVYWKIVKKKKNWFFFFRLKSSFEWWLKNWVVLQDTQLWKFEVHEIVRKIGLFFQVKIWLPNFEGLASFFFQLGSVRVGNFDSCYHKKGSFFTLCSWPSWEVFDRFFFSGNFLIAGLSQLSNCGVWLKLKNFVKSGNFVSQYFLSLFFRSFYFSGKFHFFFSLYMCCSSWYSCFY